MLAGGGWRLDLEGGEFVDAQGGEIREPDGGAGAEAGAEAVADAEGLVGGAGRPRGLAGGGDFDLAFESEQEGVVGGEGVSRQRDGEEECGGEGFDFVVHRVVVLHLV